MSRLPVCLIILSAWTVALAHSAECQHRTIRRVADIQSVTTAEASNATVLFELEGWILMSGSTFTFEDDSGAYNFGSYLSDTNVLINAGDRVRISGQVVYEYGGIYTHCKKLTVLGHREPPAAVRSTIADLVSGKLNYRLVTIRGEIDDVYQDEIAPNWVYFSLAENGQSIYLPLQRSLCTNGSPESLIGKTVETTGFYVFGDNLGMRQSIGRLFITNRPPTILPSQSNDLFTVPELENCRPLGPAEIAALGRRRIRGIVLAVWRGNCVLVKSVDGRLTRLNLVSGPLPQTGDAIEAAGVPSSDLYNVNLERARWRPTSAHWKSDKSPVDLAVANLFVDEKGRHRINPEHHGQSIRFRGTVCGLPSGANADHPIVVESDGFLLSVDFSSCPEVLSSLGEGCRVEISGVCIADVDNWQPGVVFPRIKEIFVVLPTASSIRILARPSWWTAGRLLTVIGTLLAVLIGICIWNFTLRRIAERRGRELNEESIARVTSDLKLYERTRLAVELHDSFAQSLTGVSLEIKTASRLADAGEPGMREHLATASQTLESCRSELRNCLWDLRHHALELEDMNDAIRQTLAPVLGSARLSVRFAVERDRLTDNTAHTILRVIRELTVNAIRHGAASEIKVAGSAEDGRLNVSVRDNGSGFDPSSAPGVEQGHFGIEGIRERISPFKGTLRFDSAGERGTKAVVSLEIPHETNDEIDPST